MDEKVREKARNAIKDILETAGFQVSTLEYPYDLAAREDEYLMVLCSDDPAEIRDYAAGNFRLMSEGKEITYRKLLFSLDPGTEPEGCILWGRDEFIRLSGEAALARILSRPLALDLGSGTLTGAQGESVSLPGERKGGPAGGADVPGVTIPHLPIRVKKDAAVQIAKMQGTVALKFMPFWFYSYRSSGEQVYKEHRVPFDAEGDGGLNAINGLKFEVDAKSLVEDAVPAGAEVVSPRITQEEAREKIVSEVAESLTQRIRIKQVSGDAISYEEKVLKPDRRNIEVTVRQVYVPIWQVRGKKIVEVNAFSGEVLSSPMDEGVEIF
ncbi:MAG: hypothetical protein NQU46_06590 [Methanolinea sp.]|nr:hypothetical protein [Methanolinea sp.]